MGKVTPLISRQPSPETVNRHFRLALKHLRAVVEEKWRNHQPLTQAENLRYELGRIRAALPVSQRENFVRALRFIADGLESDEASLEIAFVCLLAIEARHT